MSRPRTGPRGPYRPGGSRETAPHLENMMSAPPTQSSSRPASPCETSDWQDASSRLEIDAVADVIRHPAVTVAIGKHFPCGDRL